MNASTSFSPNKTVLTESTSTTEMGMCNSFDVCIQGIIGGVGVLLILTVLLVPVVIIVPVIVVAYKKEKSKMYSSLFLQMSRKSLTINPSSKYHINRLVVLHLLTTIFVL